MIKVSSPLLQGNEKKYLCQAIDEGEVSSEGKFVRRFEEAFAAWSGNKYAVAVNSGTAALECAIWSLLIGLSRQNKRIAIPDHTIISCALAAIRAGAMPLFYEGQIQAPMIMRCHLFGCFNDKVAGPIIVDDASQYWKPFKPQDVACYSLYANKLITCGEGGILVTNREDIFGLARSYRDLCREPGERFVHYDLGYNFRMSNLQAAVALAQLEQINKHIEIKQRNRDLYKKYLKDLWESEDIEIAFDTEVPWMYLIKTPHDAGIICKALIDKGIDCRRHFAPLHSQPPFAKFTIGQGPFYISENLWDHYLYLPSGLTLTERDIEDVCKGLCEVLREAKQHKAV